MSLLALGAWRDVRTFRIPNVLTLGGAALALAMAVCLPGGQGGWSSLAGWAAGLVFLLPLYAFGLMGAGDVKLLGMAGAFTGPAGALVTGLYTLIAGGVLGVAVAAGGGRLLQALRNVQAMALPRLTRDVAPATASPASAGRLPYGVAILAGSLAWWWRAAG